MSAVKSIALFVARQFGFGGRKPTTRLGKYARRANRALSIATLLYFALAAFPQMLFAYNVNAQGVTVYSRAPLPAETAARIDEAMKLVGQSELAVPGRTERVFVCNNPWLYRFFYPIPRDEIAVEIPWTRNIFVRDADLVQNIARGTAAVHNQRSFSSTVAHEITHDLIRHRIGIIRGIFLRGWVDEGYSDYVAQKSSFPEEEGSQMLRDGKEDPSPSFRYFVYRQMVRHLIEDRHYSFDEIVKRAGDEAAIKAETIAAIKEADAR
jgi:hypothetical protein